MCLNPWLINTLRQILFIVSDAEWAPITAWLLPLTAPTTKPSVSRSIYYLPVVITVVGRLPVNHVGGSHAVLTQMNLQLF